MKTMIALFLVGAALTVSAQTNRVWNFKGGTNFSGIYVSSGTTKVVIKNHGTNYIFNLDDLAADDLARVTAIKEKQAAAAAAAAEAREKYQEKLDAYREKFQSVCGIWSSDTDTHIRYKKFDLRSDGSGIYLLENANGNQQQGGKFQWSFTGDAVILSGTTYKLEGGDLIDEKGNRWLHIR